MWREGVGDLPCCEASDHACEESRELHRCLLWGGLSSFDEDEAECLNDMFEKAAYIPDL